MTKEDKRAYDREWYAKNKSRIRKDKNENTRLRRKRNTEFVFNYLKTHPCVDCGENDPIVLEFDHQHSKSRSLSDMKRQSYSIEAIIAEIEKCEVRCANCHRRRTAKQFNYYK